MLFAIFPWLCGGNPTFVKRVDSSLWSASLADEMQMRGNNSRKMNDTFITLKIICLVLYYCFSRILIVASDHKSGVIKKLTFRFPKRLSYVI